MENEIKALVKLRYGNLEKNNKYWKDEEMCTLWDRKTYHNIEHYIKECQEMKTLFHQLDMVYEGKWRKI